MLTSALLCVFTALALTPADFVHGLRVEEMTDTPGQRVELPGHVYVDVVRSDLRDVRVFNGVGDEVPHALRRPERGATAHELSITGSEGPTANVYVFELPGAFPVHEAVVRLPETNTVIKAALFSAPGASGPWTRRYRGILRHLESKKGRARPGPSIALTRVRDRHWKLEVDGASGGIGRGMPVLELKWRAERLVFLARGDGPFTLAYRSFVPMPAPAGAAAIDELERTASSAGDARLAPAPMALGGPESAAAVEEARASFDWLALLVWMSLGIGVLVLAAVSLRLGRQLQSG